MALNAKLYSLMHDCENLAQFTSHVLTEGVIMWQLFVSFHCKQTLRILVDFVSFVSLSPNGGHSTAGDFDSEVDGSTVSSRRGSRRREKHSINRNEGT